MRLIDADALPIDPVRHGKWIVDYESRPRIMECTKCGWLFSYMSGLEEEWNYCPNCGAKMDGE